ncbi:transcriptional regulator [Devosia sp. I507]|nr:transcriptional regulator [Devosia sp. I507]|tara:strand:+ start:651 stop:1016 length:366 start_codon:yes stop_codon:yes gene_type:complete
MMDEKLVAYRTGNVFADLGLENPEEELAKSRIVAKIASVIRERNLTQAQAASITGIAQPKISSMVRGHFEEFSSDRLYRVLNRLGVSVILKFEEEPEWSPGRTLVADSEENSEESAPAMAF